MAMVQRDLEDAGSDLIKQAHALHHVIALNSPMKQRASHMQRNQHHQRPTYTLVPHKQRFRERLMLT